MSTLPEKAKVVIIGAGIVGNSLVYHLADLGWTDMVLVDKGPLPNPGGSTGHASNFIFPVDHSKEMTKLTRDSIDTYDHFGTFTMPGGIELARTPERMQEAARRVQSAKAWGEEGEVISAERIKELAPFVNTDEILGGFYSPTAGVVDPLQCGTMMRQYALDRNAVSIHANVEVEDIIVKDGEVKAVVTSIGTCECEYAVIATGVWSPLLAEMCGIKIPLVPIVHQFMTVGPVPMFEETTGEIVFPMIRDVDSNMYQRQNGSDLEIGSYCHRTIIHRPEDIPSYEESTYSPTELPFTEEDFDESLGIALELMPDIVGDENVGVRHAINGLMSMTPDGMAVIGEAPNVKGLWSCAAIWIKEAPGFARATAQLMTHGVSEIDITASSIARFYPHSATQHHVDERIYETFNRMYSIIHPAEQYASSRGVRKSPFYSQCQELGAVFYEAVGWERPQWFESNAGLVEKYGDAVMPRSAEWDSRWWSPIINAEHLQMRETAGMVDLTAFSVFDVVGAGVVAFLQGLTVNQVNVKIGRSVYTPLLDVDGGFKSDLTILRLARHHYRIVTGGGFGNVDKKWFSDHLPEDGSVFLQDMTSALCTIGLWGPNARKILQSMTEDDVSNEAMPYGSVKTLTLDNIVVSAFRISYVGELGWEIYTTSDLGMTLWERLHAAGQEHGLIPVGIGVYGTTARLEKGYRAFGAELETEYNPVEAGLARARVKKADFIGKEAYLKARAEEPVTLLCTLSLDDPTEATGEARYMLGGEPIMTLDGEPILDAHGRRSYVTSAGSAPSMGKHCLLGYLPPAYAKVGEKLLVEYLGMQFHVTVEVVGNTPWFDADDSRMKA